MDIWKAEFWAVGEACRAIVIASPGFEKGTPDSSGFTKEGTQFLHLRYPTAGNTPWMVSTNTTECALQLGLTHTHTHRINPILLLTWQHHLDARGDYFERICWFWSCHLLWCHRREQCKLFPFASCLSGELCHHETTAVHPSWPADGHGWKVKLIRSWISFFNILSTTQGHLNMNKSLFQITCLKKKSPP